MKVEREKITQESSEYDRRWTDDSNYSAEQIGYTPRFLRLMSEGFSALTSGASVLEIGCGNGFFSEQLSKKGLMVTAVDLSRVGLQKAKSRCPAGEFILHDLGQPLPFVDGRFDGIWCSEVLEHLFAPQFVLGEALRVLKPGGALLATVPYHGLLKNLAIAAFAFDSHYDPTYPHIRFFTKKTLRKITSETGFQIDQISVCGSQLGVRDWLFPTNILLQASKRRT